MTGIEEAVAVVGVGTAVYGAISSASAKASADQKNAALKNQQADELLSRETVNESLIQDQSFRSQLDYGAAANSTGVGGGGLGGIMAIQKATAITIANDQRDANFKAYMLRQGANMDTNLASDTMSAGYISAAGTLLSGGAKVYSAYQPASSTPISLATPGGD